MYAELRRDMVDRQIRARGVSDARVLHALESVPRELFVPAELKEFAYEDRALPIPDDQTISQPYVVALMAEALELEPGDRVLDVGTGSGYAAAVLAHLVDHVYTVERHGKLAGAAQRRFDQLGLDNVRVRVGDGTLGWEAHAPFDGIQVAAGGPGVPRALEEQLAPRGRLVLPAGGSVEKQSLLRVRRTPDGLEREDLGAVRFVPLVGAEGWASAEDAAPRSTPPRRRPATPPVSDRIRAAAEPFDDLETASLSDFLHRVGSRRVVLLGESSHGTSEFYRMRARLTRALIEEKGVRIVALEADWPDASVLDAFVRGRDPDPAAFPPFARFPRWMWANHETVEFLQWLRGWNEAHADHEQVGVYGLDLYSLHRSMEVVLAYLSERDPEAADVARIRYGCLTPWTRDPAVYGRAVVSGSYRGCEGEVLAQLSDLLERRTAEAGPRGFDAERNARVVAEAERYYRAMYYGGRESWNLRDRHMAETLEALVERQGPDACAAVWAHNSHIGDATATEMGGGGQINLGQIVRERFGADAYLVGAGTHEGTVAAAHDWDGPMEVMDVRPSLDGSYESACHETGLPRFFLPLGKEGRAGIRRALHTERLERAIGVIYRPDTERVSHYFRAVLPWQFDEWIWFDSSRAVDALELPVAGGSPAPDTYPFGL